jgi:hypothetical protein
MRLRFRPDPGMVLIVGVAVVVAALGLDTPRFSLAFYAAVAALIPVVLLTVLVQARYLIGLDQRNPFDRFLLHGFVYLPLLGEAAALNALTHGTDSPVIRGTVLVALGVTAGLLMLCVSDGPAPPSSTRSTTEAAPRRPAGRGGVR